MKDDYAKLLEFRQELFPSFKEDQASGAKSICELIDHDVRGGVINTIVDVGCGTGEILKLLLEELRQFCEEHSIRGIGIDCCEKEIAEAKKEAEREQIENCEFYVLSAEELTKLGEGEQLGKPIDWDHTLMLCVGHTLPHFHDFPKFLGALKELHPAFLFVDFYHSWDETVKDFIQKGITTAREPKIITDDFETFVLTTQKSDTAGRVKRGIEKINPTRAPLVADLGFWTDQELRSSEDFEKDFAHAGYLPERSGLHYHCGYGRMRGSLMSWRSSIAKKMNSSYYKVVGGFVKQLFADDPIKSEMGKFATKVVAVILPFDARKVFARYISLIENGQAPDALMEVHGTGAGRSGPATARGLYMALLSQVGSSMVIPYAELEDHPELTKNDQDLYKAEEEFFAVSRQGVPQAEGYFIVPVYYASLPLFCVVLSLPTALVGRKANPQEYVGLLVAFYNRLKEEVDDAFESSVLIPFFQSALSDIEEGEISVRCEAIGELRKAILMNRERPWKSWLMTIPSIPITRLREVTDQQAELEKMLSRAQENACAEVMVRIANWFRGGQFFSWEGRDLTPHQRCTDVHCARLTRMLDAIKCGSLDELEKRWEFGDPSCIPKEIRWLVAQLSEIGQKKAGQESAKSTEAFLNLKSVFYRVREGQEWRFRFSSRRIACMCAMYIPETPIANYWEEPNEDVPDTDPVPSLAEIALQLGQLFPGNVQGITLTSTDEEVNGPCITRNYELRFTLSRRLTLWTKGTASQALVDALRAADPELDCEGKSASEIALSFKTKVTRIRSRDEKNREKIRWTNTTILPGDGKPVMKVTLT